MVHIDEIAAAGEIILDGVRLPLVGNSVKFTDLARFQPKLLFGDPSKDDNDLLSSWQFDNFSGGSGVSILKEGTDQGRFNFGTLYGRFPGMLTKPAYVTSNSAGGADGGAGDKYMLGEMWSASTTDFKIYWTAGLGIKRSRMDTFGINIDSFETAAVGSLTTAAVGKATAFMGTHTEERLFIPQGNAGYAHIADSVAVPTEFATPKFSAFTVYDNKLIGITTGGRMYFTLDGTTWTAYDTAYQLSKSYRIRDLVTFVDRRDEPAVFVLTDRDLWQFDPDGPELFRVSYGWPGHPYSARASAVWNDQLYISTGMGVFRYTGGTFMPIGLDRDFGLPPEYQGYITDMVASHRGLFAMVQGIAPADTDYGNLSSIHEFNGSGWQCYWSQDTTVPTSGQYHGALAQTASTMGSMIITQSRAKQALVFSTKGADDKVYSSPIDLGNANPRAGVRQGQLFNGGLYFYLLTGRFNADMYGYDKIANAIQVKIEEPKTLLDITKRDELRIYAQIDDGAWTLMAQQRADPGRYAFPFGDPITIAVAPPGHPELTLYTGAQFEDIEFRIELRRSPTGTESDRPCILSNFAFSFLKTVDSNDAFEVAINCSSEYHDKGPRELQDFIDGLTSLKKFCAMTVADRTYRVYVSQNQGDRSSGEGNEGMRNLSIVEIPTGF